MKNIFLYSSLLALATPALSAATAATTAASTTVIHSGQMPTENANFISDATYRSKVDKAFEQKMQLVGSKFFNAKNLNATPEELQALKFLYAYMPLADATDYTTQFYLDNIRTSFEAKRNLSWGKNVPELLFRHFVLPIRVNNENLDNSRMIFYKELKERIKGMNMKEAILEVNHWCHEYVTYQPSDGRTSPPLSTIRSAYGRCGEQSTFTVAALRAVGIPARQVYTPRWAHTDDNHAWVEAWADGQWFFLGACEPEPVLNLGWFNAPASRALLMHTKAFGDYNGSEEVLLRTNNITEINLIDNYAETARANFNIVDKEGRPVEGARVDFKIYNYAEFCTVVTKYSDNAGHSFLTAGKGDMIVWASKDGKYGFKKVSFGKDKDITIPLDNDMHNFHTSVDSMNIVPPAEKTRMPEVTAEQRRINNERFAYEDSIRHAYLATFYNEETARKAVADNQLPDAAIELLLKSRGNHQTILNFMLTHRNNIDRAIEILQSISDKDLRDMQTDILDDNFYAQSNQLSPRVETEMIIHPFKQFFEKAFTKKEADKFRNDPSTLVNWIKKNIRINPDKKALAIAQTPIGVWESRLTDVRSRKIFFVDVARSLNIEAKVDPITKKTQYRKDGKWVDVDFDAATQKVANQGKLMLGYKGNGMVDDPKYYSHFSLTRINDDGTTTLLEFDEEGVTWQSTFKNGILLDEGNYILITGTRLANGGVLSANQIFHIADGKTTTIDMKLRTSPTEVSVIGNFNSESKFRKIDINTINTTNTQTANNVQATADAQEVSILSQTGRGYFIMGLIGVGQEPTNHALKDIAKVAKSFEKWNRPMLLIFEDESAARKFSREEFPGLPQNIIYGIDTDGKMRKEISQNMKLAHQNLSPIFFIGDTFNRVVYFSQGYTIGLGEQMEGVVRKL